jgi:hypothetical protein
MTTEDWDFILEEVIETLPGKKLDRFVLWFQVRFRKCASLLS